MKPLEEFKVKGLRVELWPDEDPGNPRENDNFGMMECFHNKYKLGDRTEHSSKDFGGWGQLAEHLKAEHGAEIILPLYLYDHSGLRMKVGSFQGLLPQGHAEFDSGQVGFIYATKADILGNWNVKQLSKALLKKAEERLTAEVTEYDLYLSGQVYGYQIFKDAPAPKCPTCGHVGEPEELDSCWGCFGYDYAVKTAREAAERIAKGK